MKEIKLKIDSLWGCITIVFVAFILSGSAIFIGYQHNETQKEIANIQAEAVKQSTKQSSENIKNGLDTIGSGICKTSDRQFIFCN